MTILHNFSEHDNFTQLFRRKYMKMHENTRKYTKIHENARKFTKMQEKSRKYKKIHENMIKIHYTTCIFYIIIDFTLGVLKKKAYTSLSYGTGPGPARPGQLSAGLGRGPRPTAGFIMLCFLILFFSFYNVS